MSQSDVEALRQGRSGLLDCIRAVAITLVVFFHVSVPYPGRGNAFEQFFAAWGSKGVDIFFPLSGFLISSFLLQSTRPDFIKVFFMRRVFRILPLYVVMVSLAGLAMYVTGTQTHLLDRLWINYTFLTAWVLHFSQNPNAVPYTITWSLSVEEFSYVLFGLVALVNRRALPWVLLALSVLPIGLKYWYASHGAGFYFYPLARIDSIAIGGVAAWLMISGQRPLLWLGLMALIAGGFAVSSLTLFSTLSLTILALVTAMVIVAIRKWASRASNPLIAVGASIGFYSYFTYLFHVFVIEAVFMVLPKFGYPPYWVVALLCLGITHVAAMISYRWFEGPLMRFGRRLEGRRPAPEASLPEPPTVTGEGARAPSGPHA